MNAHKASHSDLIDSLLADCKKPGDLVGEHGLLKKISQSLVKRTVHAEREHIAMYPVREIDHG